MISCPSDTHTVCCTGTACYSPGKPAGGGRDEGRSAQTSLAAAAALSGGGLGGRSKEGGRYLVLGYVPAMLLRHPRPPTPSFVVEQEDVNHGLKKNSNPVKKPTRSPDQQPHNAEAKTQGPRHAQPLRRHRKTELFLSSAALLYGISSYTEKGKKKTPTNMKSGTKCPIPNSQYINLRFCFFGSFTPTSLILKLPYNSQLNHSMSLLVPNKENNLK